MSDQNRSAGTLVGDALDNVSKLIRNEFDLARAEVSENANRAVTALGLIAGAAIVALVTLNTLVAALVAALTETGLDAGWAALIVSVVLAIVAFAMLQKGTNDLKLSKLAPTRTMKNVQRDAEAVKETYDDK
ncbi:MAG: phage holin family protein [Paracoccaceae bacterium]